MPIRLGFILLLLLLTLPAQATEDSAILAAQIQAANSSGSGAITLSGDIILTVELPAVTGDLTIDGRGHGISGGGEYRIFAVDGGQLTLRDIRLSDGKAESGGAITVSNEAMLKLEDASLLGNIAETKGGAIYVLGGSLQIKDSRFEKNCVRLLRRRLNPGGQGPERVERGVDDDGCSLVTQYRSSLDGGGEAAGQGGAIHLAGGARADIDSSTFSENRATDGGAVAATSGSRLDIDGSYFADNEASSYAGAVLAEGSVNDIINSSFVKNAAYQGGGAVSSSAGMVRISNSTFSENQSETDAGAVSAQYEADVTITHASFVNNWSLYRDAGALQKRFGGRLRLRNSIIMGRGRDEDCVGGLDENIGNLSTDGSCAIKASEDPLLGELTGSPPYHPLLDGSPAIDQADPRFCPEADQNGTARSPESCDIGAIEATGAQPAPEPIVPPPACSLADQIIAANTDRPSGGCPAGHGADTISLSRNILLFAPLPAITSVIAIDGNGYAISGDNKFRIFDVDRGDLAINNLRLMAGNAPSGTGGALRLQNGGRASVSDSSFIASYAQTGGAIGLNAIGNGWSRLSVERSHFERNRAGKTGGAIDLNGGSAVIANSSFVSSSAGQTGGAISMLNYAKLELSNSSILDGGSGWGGSALAAENGADATLTHVTIFNRNPMGAGSELYVIQSAYGSPSRVRLRNSIIAEAGPAYIQLCQGQLTENINNIIEGGTCSPMLDADPMLEAPDDDSTHIAPLPGSPAIKAADPRFCPATDQLGNARPQAGRCDIGAIETAPVMRAIGECQVKTTHKLNFRDGPAGSGIGTVPAQTALSARQRTQAWFQVEYRGASGWISADYVKTEGACS